MTFAFVNEAHNLSYNATGPYTTSLSVAAGNLLVAWQTWSGTNSSYPSIVGDGRNTWVPIFSSDQAGGYGTIQAWYAIAQKTETTEAFFSRYVGTDTPGPAGSGILQSTQQPQTFAGCQLLQFSGQWGSNPLDAVGTFATGTSTAPAASVIASGTSDLVIGVAIPTGGDTLATTAGWINAAGVNNSAIYAVQTSSGTFTPTFLQNASAAWGCMAIAFKSAVTASHTISGSLGSKGSGATVLFRSTTTFYTVSAAADDSGNYISPALANDTYTVIPEKLGATFSPSFASQTVSGANVSGLNFTAALAATSLTLTTIISDTMSRANENPLSDGGNWSQDGTPIPPWDPPCQLLSDECCMSTVTIYANYAGPWSGDGISVWTGSSLPDNQFAQFQIDDLSSSPLEYARAQILVRAANDDSTGYNYTIRNNGDGTCDLVLFFFGTSGGVPTPAMALANGAISYGVWQKYNVSFSLGDTFGIAAIGTTLYMMHNGLVIGNYSDSTLASGTAVISLNGNTISDVQISHFKGGSAVPASNLAYSVPDCRDYFVFPNDSVNVQGTLTYTVPAHPSHFDPVDSRKSKPIDSRISPNIPENSRTYPPFES